MRPGVDQMLRPVVGRDREAGRRPRPRASARIRRAASTREARLADALPARRAARHGAAIRRPARPQKPALPARCRTSDVMAAGRRSLGQQRRGDAPSASPLGVDQPNALRLGRGEAAERGGDVVVKRPLARGEAIGPSPVARRRASAPRIRAALRAPACGRAAARAIRSRAAPAPPHRRSRPPRPDRRATNRRSGREITQVPTPIAGWIDLLDMVGARGGEQQRLGMRAPAVDRALHQQIADRLRAVAAAGLARDDHFDPARRAARRRARAT